MIDNPASRIDSRITPESATVPQLSSGWLKVLRVAWVALAVTVIFILITSLPGYAESFAGDLAHISPDGQTTWTAVLAVLSSIASLGAAILSITLATVFYRQRLTEPMAAALSFYLLLYAVVMAGPLEIWSSYWLGPTNLALKLQGMLIAVPTVMLFCLFPNGRFVPDWSRWLALTSVPLGIAFFLLPSDIPNALSGSSQAAVVAYAIVLIGAFLVGLYAQYYRYRYVSTAVERQQTKWVMYGFVLWLGYIMLSTAPYYYLESLPEGSEVPLWASASVLGWFLALNIIPVCLAVAVTRHRLWEIDVIINRSLVYAALTACIVVVYVLVVVGVGAIFQTQGNWLVALAATGVIAVLFQPLRDRLQRWVNRLLYGQRDEPFEVLAKLGQRLENSMSPETVYPTIVESVAQTLKLPYAAIAVKQHGRIETAVSYGKPTEHVVEYPLAYQGEVVGQLVVAPRSAEDTFNEADERLLRNIARQAGTAVHAAQLTDDLKQSRQQIVTSREEERRRLRRDLHDDLGPSLAAHMLKIGSARALLKDHPETTDSILAEMESDIESTLSDLRRIVYDLRPPALDQWGLAGALRAYAETCEQSDAHSSLSVDVIVPDALPTLPAAVEVATYHIGREGLTNVVRHAHATCCELRLSVSDAPNQILKIAIQDDGRGIAAGNLAGVGLVSMRERAEELGGYFTIDSQTDKGTLVTASIPLVGDKKIKREA